MATAAVLQTAWNCRWGRQGDSVSALAETIRLEGPWWCTRDGAAHAVGEEACARCARWEPLAAATASVRASSGEVAAVYGASLAATGRIGADDLAQAAFRAVLALIAIAFFATGLAILSTPLAVPLTLGLWLCGAVPLGLAVFGRFSARP